MALRASRTSAAARRCWGSRTSSLRMRHTVFSETRPSLAGRREGSGGGRKVGRWGAPSCGSKQDLLGNSVLGCLDLAEELLRDAVVEGELAIQHGEEHHAQGPHVTRLAPVWPACGRRDIHSAVPGSPHVVTPQPYLWPLSCQPPQL